MTIPTLITNNQEKGWDVSASTFEAKFGQALKVMNTQNTLAGLNTTENFVAELQHHMKINKVCDNTKLTECFTSEINGARSVIDVVDATTYENDASKPTQVSLLKKSNNIGQKTWGTNTMGLQFANGVSAIVAYNPKCSANPFNNDSVVVSGGKDSIKFNTDCVAMIYDISGYKNPNELNKDIRTSVYASVGDGNCVFKIDGKCVTKIVPSGTYVTSARCLEMLDEGKLSGGCPGYEDYWAGAVDACGNVSKMPNAKQLTQIANYIYDDADISENSEKDAQRIDDRVEALGLLSSRGAYLGIWGNTVVDHNFVRGRNYLPEKTADNSFFGRYITNTLPHGICME